MTYSKLLFDNVMTFVKTSDGGGINIFPKHIGVRRSSVVVLKTTFG